MTARTLLDTLEGLGVTVTASGGNLRLEPARDVPLELIPELKFFKEELLSLLNPGEQRPESGQRGQPDNTQNTVSTQPAPTDPWAELVQHSSTVYLLLERTGWGALRCVADEVAVVSVYLVSSARDVQWAALSAGRYYPHTQQLEVYAVRSDVGGALLKALATFTTQGGRP